MTEKKEKVSEKTPEKRIRRSKEKPVPTYPNGCPILEEKTDCH
jgi:hypothetical protein